MVGGLIFSAQKVVSFNEKIKCLQKNPHQSNKQAAPLPTYPPPHGFFSLFIFYFLFTDPILNVLIHAFFQGPRSLNPGPGAG